MTPRKKFITGISALIIGLAANAELSSSNAAPPAAPPQDAVVLRPLDLRDMRAWNWSGKWLASEWPNVNGPIPWRYNHIVQRSGRDTIFTLDAAGAPQLQALNGTPAYTRGLWETDVTLPSLRDGMITAPLWIYDTGSKDEIDFEFAGRKGLDVSMHVYVDGVHKQNTVRLFAGTDMSGQRHRFGIKIDEPAGYVEMYLDGRRIHRWDRGSSAAFISNPMKPWIEVWPTNSSNAGLVQWAGVWKGLRAGEKLAMTVHGYGYTALP